MPMSSPALESDQDPSLHTMLRVLAGLQQQLPDYPLELALLTRLAVHVEKRMADRAATLLKPFELTYPMYQALVMVFAQQTTPLSPTDLALATGERTTNITHLCNELERRELLLRQRDTQDRRKISLQITAQGMALLQQLQPQLWQLWQQRYRDFESAERQQLQQLLRRQYANLGGTDRGN